MYCDHSKHASSSVQQEMLPVRWMALESLEDLVYNTNTDVYVINKRNCVNASAFCHQFAQVICLNLLHCVNRRQVKSEKLSNHHERLLLSKYARSWFNFLFIIIFFSSITFICYLVDHWWSLLILWDLPEWSENSNTFSANWSFCIIIWADIPSSKFS